MDVGEFVLADDEVAVSIADSFVAEAWKTTDISTKELESNSVCAWEVAAVPTELFRDYWCAYEAL